MKALSIVCVLTLCLFAFCPVRAQSNPDRETLANQIGQVLTGKVIGVASGETFTMITTEKIEVEVWLAEIEAPEKGQVYWDASRRVLEEKVLGNMVTVQVVSIRDMEDGYNYVIAQAHIGDRWINKEMVAEGWAWHFPQYFDSPELAQAEQEAKDTKAGLWAVTNPETPLEFEAPSQEMPEASEDQVQPLVKIAL